MDRHALDFSRVQIVVGIARCDQWQAFNDVRTQPMVTDTQRVLTHPPGGSPPPSKSYSDKAVLRTNIPCLGAQVKYCPGAG